MSQTIKLCDKQDLIANSGVCAVLENDAQQQQIALFYLPEQEQQVYAIGNWDPIGEANVLSRGIVGTIGDELVVASPLYKQHFSLNNGSCLEQEDVSVPVFQVELTDEGVLLTPDATQH